MSRKRYSSCIRMDQDDRHFWTCIVYRLHGPWADSPHGLPCSSSSEHNFHARHPFLRWYTPHCVGSGTPAAPGSGCPIVHHVQERAAQLPIQYHYTPAAPSAGVWFLRPIDLRQGPTYQKAADSFLIEHDKLIVHPFLQTLAAIVVLVVLPFEPSRPMAGDGTGTQFHMIINLLL